MEETAYSVALPGALEVVINLVRSPKHEQAPGWKYRVAIKYTGAEIMTVTGPAGASAPDSDTAVDMAVRVAEGALRAMQIGVPDLRERLKPQTEV